MLETWKPINEYEDIYEISNIGRIRNVKNKKIVKSYITKHGYKRVQLSKNGKRKNHFIHRLVAEVFIPKPNDKNYVNHIDFNRTNNNIKNLEWTTAKENIHHSMDNIVKAALRTKKPVTKHHNIYKNRNHFQVRVQRYGKVIIDKTFVTLKEAIGYLAQQGV